MKVVFCYPNNGLTSDQKTARERLHEGQEYEVEREEISNWHTDVYLKEFPGIGFNSVMFSGGTHGGEGK